MNLIKFKHYLQRDAFDCGPTCLMMVAQHYGKKFTLPFLRDISYLTNVGVSAAGIVEAAERIGFRTVVTKLNFKNLGGGAIIIRLLVLRRCRASYIGIKIIL